MAIKIKSIKIPTDIYIIGYMDFETSTKRNTASIGITDDYASINIIYADGKEMFETDGLVRFLTEDEVLKHKDNLLKDSSFKDETILMIKDFQGDIMVRVLNEDDQDVLKKSFKIKQEYITHELKGEYDYVEPQIYFSEKVHLFSIRNGEDLIKYLTDENAHVEINAVFQNLNVKERIELYDSFLIRLHTAAWTGNADEITRLMKKVAAYSYARTNSNEFQTDNDTAHLYHRTLKGLGE